MKTCFKCNKEKPLANFYRHSKMADGYLGKCKTCTKFDANKYRSENLEKVREYDKKRSKEPHRIALSTQQTKMWREADKRRTQCHNAVARAIRNGSLVQQPCERCSSEKTLAHHESYDFPLEIVWLCQPCHKQRHKELVG
jgi:hypothetical protein